MSNTVRLDAEPKRNDFAQVAPLVAAQKFITYQNGGSCSTSVPALKVEEALAWWSQMFSEVDDGCGEVVANENDDTYYEDENVSQEDEDVYG